MRGPIVQYLCTLGCQHSLAEEITQEAFLRFHRGLLEGLQVHDVRAWVFRVARNLWIDTRRDHQRFWTSWRDDGDPPDLAHIDSSPGPEQQALRRERIRLIEEEVQRLPDLHRKCIQLKSQGLRYYESRWLSRFR